MVGRCRADARRNRERLLAAAAVAFGAADGQPVALEAIARAAGVGIGTLYRHFPSREALIEAVFGAELAEVADAGAQLLAQYPPKIALRRWMDRYARFVATKRGMADSLRVMTECGALQPSELRERIVEAIAELLRAGVADGSLRAESRADDVMSALIGIFLASGSPEQTGRLLDLLVAGMAAGTAAEG